MNNPMDYIKVALIAFVAIWVINRGLVAMGLGQFQTSQPSNS